MRLITLNTWGGKLFDQLTDFLRKRRDDTDIFCFQEVLFGPEARFTEEGVRENLFDEFCAALPGFAAYPRYAPEGAYFNKRPLDFRLGTAIFVRNDIKVTGDGGFPLYPEGRWDAMSPETHITGEFQFAEVRATNSKTSYLVGNVHGLWFRGSKSDTPERLEEAKRLADFFSSRGDKHVLCGDFNLLPETESVATLSRTMRNLIAEFGAKSTRNKFYKDMEKYKDYIADYVFVSPDTEVRRFEVLPDEVSDHQPLLIEFS